MKIGATLLYDDYCPLCSWYSGLFVRYKFLKPESRVAFSSAKMEILACIDIDRARNEIPLFDEQTKEAKYGIDALLEIFGSRWPTIKRVGHFPPINWFLRRSYKLVSYNRKVIVAKKCGDGRFDCAPSFNVFYRVIFLSLSLIFNSLMLYPLHNKLFSPLPFYRLSFYELQFSHMIFVLINCVIACLLKQRKALEYLGQVNMLAIMTILLLLPAIVVLSLVPFAQWIVLFYLICLTSFVVKEYFRRMGYANILLNHKSIVATNLVCLAAFLIYVFH